MAHSRLVPRLIDTISYFILGFILLFSLTSLYATKLLIEENSSLKNRLNSIDQYEEEGNYIQALKIARDTYEEVLKMELSQETIKCLQTVDRLQEKVLTQGFSKILFDENYQPRPKLLQLLKLVGWETLNSSENSIEQINEWAQKNLLRQGERWQEQTNRFEGLKTHIEPLLKALGGVDTVLPNFTEYQGAIIHGSTLLRVRLRLHYLVEQWKQGVRFSQLYFLSGERPLAVEQENREALIQADDSLLKIRKDWKEPSKLPTTENQMIQVVWEQSEIPADMRKQVKVQFINAPMKKNSNLATLQRPTTEDTVEIWLKTLPPIGRYLAISNAPYIHRQDLVIRTIAPEKYHFDTVGPGAHQDEKIAIFLDELARLIFQTNANRNHTSLLLDL